MTEQQTLAEVIAKTGGGVDFIRNLVGAWDCCGTCAGGVLSRRDRDQAAAALAWFDALLSGPVAVEVVARAILADDLAKGRAGDHWEWSDQEWLLDEAAAAITAVRALVADAQNPPQTDGSTPRSAATVEVALGDHRSAAKPSEAASDEYGSPRGLGRSDGVREAREGL